jgi:hypothetical protein
MKAKFHGMIQNGMTSLSEISETILKRQVRQAGSLGEDECSK